MKKVTLLTAVNSRSAGGLFNSVKGLALGLKSLVNISILSYDDEHSAADRITYKNIPLIIYKIIPGLSIGFSTDLYRQLKGIKPDIIHQQGIWMYFSYVANRFKNKTKCKHVITPRGMLDPWALKNSNWKKKIVGLLYENKNLQEADCIQALCDSEYQSIREYGLTNPVAIIPNGIFLPEIEVERDFNAKNKTILFLGRIHPKKGISHLIEAVKIIKNINPNILKLWTFQIGGWSQVGHEAELKLKCRDFGIENFVDFIGPQFAEDKDALLREADAFILPSYSEGLPMSILEAWAYKLPVLMTKECNIPSGFANEAAMQISRQPEELAQQLIYFMTLDNTEVENMSRNGYNLVSENFTWDKIAQQTEELYEWLFKKKNKPDFVFED